MYIAVNIREVYLLQSFELFGIWQYLLTIIQLFMSGENEIRYISEGRFSLYFCRKVTISNGNDTFLLFLLFSDLNYDNTRNSYIVPIFYIHYVDKVISFWSSQM